MLLLYTPEKQAFLGFIPNNQLEFVDHLRAIILRPDEDHISSHEEDLREQQIAQQQLQLLQQQADQQQRM